MKVEERGQKAKELNWGSNVQMFVTRKSDEKLHWQTLRRQRLRKT